MIVYQNTAGGFLQDVDLNRISDRIREAYYKATGKTRFADKEESSWINSMEFMGKVIRRSEIENDCGVLIEFGLPGVGKRIDFIVAGQDASGNKNFVIIELKQWKEAESTAYEGLVTTKYFGGGACPHPSYQASSYRTYLTDYNENVYNSNITPLSCAYLHNYTERIPEPLKADVYKKVLSDSPLYFKDDFRKLEAFIKKYVGRGKGKEILYKIESGNIRPGKNLIDHVTGLFRGNKEFTLLDEQKVAYEVAMKLALNAEKKTVVIVSGGPGTGKSVISMSLLGGILKEKKNVVFAAPNASFREVMMDKLGPKADTHRVKYLLKGSGAFFNAKENTFDVIVVDEAHRLKNEKAFLYKGENQVADIINASKVSIFFVDDDQLIRPEDIGTISEIEQLGLRQGADVVKMGLDAQFRCAGADGYINWINEALQIKMPGSPTGWQNKAYEFRIFSDPRELRKTILKKSAEGFNARMLAGYAWDWTPAKKGNTDAQATDVKIPEFGFAMPWNSRKIGTTWAIDKNGVNQLGCVHTAQGLEFDYVGVIVGNDLRIHPATKKFSLSGKPTRTKKGNRD